jgi:hypothetical protein
MTISPYLIFVAMLIARMYNRCKYHLGNRPLRFREITERPIRKNHHPVATKRRKTYIPPTDHPWRRFKIKNHHSNRERFLEFQI